MKTVRLYVVEEQEIWRGAYQSAFTSETAIEVVGTSDGGSAEAIITALSTLNPDVVLVGTKVAHTGVVEKLEEIRESYPHAGLVLLSALYNITGVKRLREFATKSSKGCAFLLKHSIDSISQLAQVIHTVTEGHVVVDPMVMGGLIEALEAKASFLKELTTRELEVLNWMSKGFKNSTIAEVLCVEPKTIERHINSIYGKLLTVSSESKHPRVHCTMLYLKAIGQLPSEDFVRE